MGTAPGDFHMTFAGDTHGGQICLPLPGRRILLSDLHAEFAEGAYDVGGRPLYVTRGVGTSMLPFRAFCRPEVVVFHVEAGAATGAGREPRHGRRLRPGGEPRSLCSPCWRSSRRWRRSCSWRAATRSRSPARTGSRPRGRRIEIRQTADGYELYYGRDRRPFPATRDGDQLIDRRPDGRQDGRPAGRRPRAHSSS